MSKNSTYTSFPLLSWDISKPTGKVKQLKLEEFTKLTEYSELYNWDIDLKKELAVVYQALVLTDLDQKILYVNEGFQGMTGYSPDFAIGKSPAFLQGKTTAAETVREFGQQLRSGKRFTESIVNYRKNGEVYLCEISIIPISCSDGELSHFLALENEIPPAAIQKQ